jgi:predicted  nucleic acid-binding Zn-ribbon protein
VIADPTAQRTLLKVQALDTRSQQLAHARKTLPQHAELTRLDGLLAALDTRLVNARTALSDVQSEVARAESDVQLVRDRAARNRGRLDAGTGTAKDLQAIQHELESLARRQADLEDIEIEVMERAETLESEVAELERQRATDLLALYDKIRAGAGGVGAAELRARRCGGCQLELNPVDVSRFATAAPDEVLRCEECRRILVRTAESGL